MYWQEAINSTLQKLIGQSRLGVITDIDGTISPIVTVPSAARVTDRSKELLADLQEQVSLVAVITGRAAADAHTRVGVPHVVYIGNHGLERWVEGEVHVSPEVEPYRAGLEGVIQDLAQYQVPGLHVEDKGATLSIHYRQTENPDQVKADFSDSMAKIAAQHGISFFPGNMIFEMRPPIDINKGTALRQLVHEYELDALVWMGDDVTDADAMVVAHELREAGTCETVCIGVESDYMPQQIRDHSDFLAEGVAGVEEFLAWLSNALRASST